MRGRKPKPTHLKAVAGNPGGRPLNDAEPETTPGIPPKPAWLEGVAADTWEELVPILDGMGVLTEVDGMALSMLCQVFADWREERSNPRGARLQSLMCEFGLTPSARSRLRVNPHQKLSPFQEYLSGGKKPA